MTLLGKSMLCGFSRWDFYPDASLFNTTIFGQEITIDISDLELTSYAYVLLVALVCGIIGIIASIFPVTSSGTRSINRIFGLVIPILVIVSVVLMVPYMSDLLYSVEISYITSITVRAFYGVYICIIGGVGNIAKNGVTTACKQVLRSLLSTSKYGGETPPR